MLSSSPYIKLPSAVWYYLYSVHFDCNRCSFITPTNAPIIHTSTVLRIGVMWNCTWMYEECICWCNEWTLFRSVVSALQFLCITGTVLAVLNYAPHHEDAWGSEGMTPYILNHSNRWSWKASFMYQLLYHRQTLSRRQCGHCGQQQISAPAGNWTLIPCCPASSLVAVLLIITCLVPVNSAVQRTMAAYYKATS